MMKLLWFATFLRIMRWWFKMQSRHFTGQTHKQQLIHLQYIWRRCRQNPFNFAALRSFPTASSTTLSEFIYFLRHLIQFLKSKCDIKKIVCFFDGAVSQYKNRKNFCNSIFHETDFSVAAKWHFFATAHGKSPCDVTGGILKKLAARASFQRPQNDQILIPADLYKWAQQDVKNIDVAYSSAADYKEERTLLMLRFSKALRVSGTRQIYAAIPSTARRVFTKTDSFSTVADEQKVYEAQDILTERLL